MRLWERVQQKENHKIFFLGYLHWDPIEIYGFWVYGVLGMPGLSDLDEFSENFQKENND